MASVAGVLNRQQATLRLGELTPGGEEYSQLQNALIKTSGIAEVCLPTTSYKVDVSHSGCTLLGGFGASEHVAIGEAVKLQGLPADNTPLLVRGVTPIRFEHIIALAGDFYGIVGQAIILGKAPEEPTERFKIAYETIENADHNEIRRILVEIEQECSAVKHSSLPHHCYSNGLMAKSKAIKKIKSDVEKLLIDNSDHFSQNAREAYQIGHAYAMQVARNAGKNKDIEGLKRAYARDAFACHFLTDLFSAGHIRNQRGALETFLISKLKIFPNNLAKKLAGVLTAAQHEKDGDDGLNVENENKDQWRAYGDGHFFSPKNEENRKKAIEATQRSVEEVYQAYVNYNSPEPIPSTVNELIPRATSFNPLPLYEIIEGTSLFLYQGSDKIPITTTSSYYEKALSQALRHLPEEYINGFINPFFGREAHPIFDKVIIPQVERLTGSVWHMIGLANYFQVKQESQQLNKKMKEMADILTKTYKNSVKILEEIQTANIQLKKLEWNYLFQEIKESISTIQDVILNRYKPLLDSDQLKQAGQKLLDAHIRMSRIFCEGTGTDCIAILEAYAQMLITTKHLSKSEVIISVTLWFRKMLDYQVQALCLYITLQVMRNAMTGNTAQDWVAILKLDLLKQIENNKNHIDLTLIYEQPTYIALQLEKRTTKRLALGKLEKIKN